MNLVMFDIDGTLTGTNDVDSRCFVQAVEDVLGIRNIDAEWDHYAHATDEGCLQEIVARNSLHPVNPADLKRVRERHFQLLRQSASSDESLFQVIPGAREMLVDLQARKNITVAFATGAWLESAIIKLTHARIDLNNIPLATSSDAISRGQIMQISEERANKTGKVFTTRIYVGDAVWDVQAAIGLGYHFIGVASGPEADALRSKGATWIVPDYSDKNRFLSTLNEIFSASSSSAESC
jgi:phosphoglycolate phosphatase-like HAD superfamily hydrolase